MFRATFFPSMHMQFFFHVHATFHFTSSLCGISFDRSLDSANSRPIRTCKRLICSVSYDNDPKYGICDLKSAAGRVQTQRRVDPGLSNRLNTPVFQHAWRPGHDCLDREQSVGACDRPRVSDWNDPAADEMRLRWFAALTRHVCTPFRSAVPLSERTHFRWDSSNASWYISAAVWWVKCCWHDSSPI